VILRRPSVTILSILVLAAGAAAAQHAPQSSGTSTASLSGPPIDLAKIKSGLAGSYYHPQDLTGIDCAATVDWASLMKQLKQPADEDRLKVLDAMTIAIKARRGKTAEITFGWPAGEPANKQRIEVGDQMVLSGFYQMYWSGIASTLGPTKQEWDTVRVEPRTGGGYVLHYSSAGSPVTEELDSDFLPVKTSINLAASTVELVMHYSPSPEPRPGDLRRVTSVDTVQRSGASITNANFRITYQQIGGYWIPAHLDLDMVGAYSIPIDLIGCSVSKEVTVLPPPAVPKRSETN
jgi:hypothetical protein